jgi:hypothetical protein
MRPVTASDVAFSEVIEWAYNEEPTNFPPPSHKIEEAINNWTAAVVDAAFDRWGCSDEECPGRPEWDRALDEVEREATEGLQEAMADLARARMMAALVKFVDGHPEAPRKVSREREEAIQGMRP